MRNKTLIRERLVVSHKTNEAPLHLFFVTLLTRFLRSDYLHFTVANWWCDLGFSREGFSQDSLLEFVMQRGLDMNMYPEKMRADMENIMADVSVLKPNLT